MALAVRKEYSVDFMKNQIFFFKRCFWYSISYFFIRISVISTPLFEHVCIKMEIMVSVHRVSTEGCGRVSRLYDGMYFGVSFNKEGLCHCATRLSFLSIPRFVALPVEELFLDWGFFDSNLLAVCCWQANNRTVVCLFQNTEIKSWNAMQWCLRLAWKM